MPSPPPPHLAPGRGGRTPHLAPGRHGRHLRTPPPGRHGRNLRAPATAIPLQILRDTTDDVPHGIIFLFANDRSLVFDPRTSQVIRELSIRPGDGRNYPASGMSALLPLDLRRDDVLSALLNAPYPSSVKHSASQSDVPWLLHGRCSTKCPNCSISCLEWQ